VADLTNTELWTILVVDDSPVVLRTVTSILTSANFTVLEAACGGEAQNLARDYAGKIDLLLSDVQMPGMSGPDLGVSLKKVRPNLHVMLMSGMTGGDLLVLNYGWAFIQKPFVATKLVQMINNVLHSPNRSQGSHQYDTREGGE
jgi:two-component system, cell cycle sensor histidine kinase and response regulator CckA